MLIVNTRASIVRFCHFPKHVIIYDQSFTIALNTLIAYFDLKMLL